MNINDLLKTIRDYIEEYRSIEYKSFKTNQNRHQDEDFMSELHIQVDDEKLWYDRVITETIQDLQKKSISENYYFFDCAFEVYKNHYEARKKEFLENHVDVNEADFLKEELLDRIQGGNNRVLFVEEKTVFYDNFIESEKKLFNSERKKVEFLLHKLELLGWDAVYIFDKDNMPLTYQFEKNNNYQPPFQGNVNTKIMDSKNFSNYIAETILEFQEFSSKEGELLAQQKERMDVNVSEEESKALSKRNEEFEIKLIEDQKKISELLKQLYYKSAEDNFYWFDCPKIVYEEQFHNIYIEYKEIFLDDNFEDFLRREINKYKDTSSGRFLKVGNIEVSYSNFVNHNNFVFSSSLTKKVHFLKKKLEEVNHQKRIKKSEQEINFYSAIESDEPEQKTEKQLTSNQIVLLLQETGFFSHPKIENTSKVKQAKLINKICGLNAKNIKKKIENLEKSPKDLGVQHQKDIDKIDAILDNLE